LPTRQHNVEPRHPRKFLTKLGNVSDKSISEIIFN
jgi:hypothetical protein